MTSAPGSTDREFADLLRTVDAIDGIDRMRFTSPHPKDLRPETIAAMAECASVCEHLHLPLQSGSDRTLARMHRGYTADALPRAARRARGRDPDLAVTTDIIVGFPGETDADFARTLDVVDDAAYDAAYTFVFSPRPGTEAAAMVDDFVPAEVVQERMQRLTEVVERHALAATRRASARPKRCSSKGRRRRMPRCGRAAAATTSSCTSPRPRPCGSAGDVVSVRVTHAAPHWLRGDFLGRRAAARRGACASPSSVTPA